MMNGMTTSKIAITVPDDVLKRAKTAVRRGRAPNLSAYVSGAIRDKVLLDDLESMFEEMLAESGGPLSAEESARADAALFGGAPLRKVR